jgi:hypothetical protein
MDFGAIINKIKENYLVIDEGKFDKLADGKGYTDAVVYLAAIMIVYLLLSAVVSLIGGVTAFMASLIAIPFALVFGIIFAFIGFGVMHIIIKLFGGKATYNQTFQVYTYSATCQYLFGWIPLVGFLAGLVSLYNVVRGVAKVHKMSMVSAALATVVVPIVIGVIIAVLFAAMFIALLGPQFGAMMGTKSLGY